MASTIAIAIDANDTSSVIVTPARMNGTDLLRKVVSSRTVPATNVTSATRMTIQTVTKTTRQRTRRCRSASSMRDPSSALVACGAVVAVAMSAPVVVGAPDDAGRAGLTSLGLGRDVVLEPLLREALERPVGVHVRDDLVQDVERRRRVGAALVQGERDRHREERLVEQHLDRLVARDGILETVLVGHDRVERAARGDRLDALVVRGKRGDLGVGRRLHHVRVDDLERLV